MYKRFYITATSLICFICFIQAQHKYLNPILAGFYPDPSICRVGNEYYMVNSTFAYYPGIPVFHSKDLVNWEQIGSAIDRPTQLDLDSQGVSRGLFAPTIRYHNGLYYIVCTLIDKGGNFIITAKNPSGPWSDPVWLHETNGIDPSLFFDDDKIFLLYNSDAPNNTSLYEGHRTIRLRELNEKLQPIGKEKILINGGTNIAQKPVWIEGPHMYKIKDWYYLMCAQGGTGTGHSEVLFRSKSLDDTFVPYEKNPILSQKNFNNAAEKYPITCTGHADIVQAHNGKWYAVFLGCRPYEGDYYFNTGRETFMAPLVWKDDWFIVNEKNEFIQYTFPTPDNVLLKRKSNEIFSGNYSFYDSFSANIINPRYLFLRNVREPWYKIINHQLAINLKPETCQGLGNPAFIGFRQAHQKCTCIVNLNFDTNLSNEQAGLLIFQNETHYYFLCKTFQNSRPVICLFKSPSHAGDVCEQLAVADAHEAKNTYLKIIADKDTYSFYYSYDKEKWSLLRADVSGKYLSTKDAGGFVGSLFAMYATSNGKVSNNNAVFKSFDYKGNDDIYKL